MSAPDLRSPLFKGCTRPAMLLGVPVIPFVIVCGSLTLGCIWISLLFGLSPLTILMVVPVFLAMRFIAKDDDQQFRLMGLRLLFRAGQRNRGFWKSAAYAPVGLGRKQGR